MRVESLTSLGGASFTRSLRWFSREFSRIGFERCWEQLRWWSGAGAETFDWLETECASPIGDEMRVDERLARGRCMGTNDELCRVWQGNGMNVELLSVATFTRRCRRSLIGDAEADEEAEPTETRLMSGRWSSTAMEKRAMNNDGLFLRFAFECHFKPADQKGGKKRIAEWLLRVDPYSTRLLAENQHIIIFIGVFFLFEITLDKNNKHFSHTLRVARW